MRRLLVAAAERGRLLALGSLLAAGLGCDREIAPAPPPPVVTDGQREPPPSSRRPDAARPLDALDAGSAERTATGQPAPAPSTAVGPIDAGPPSSSWPGPRFIVTASSAGIYSQPSLHRSLKIGYARSGGRVPVLLEKVSGKTCQAGWYRLSDGGYICSKYGTTRETDRQARLAVTEPDLTARLPYPYARNAKNGTPLYASVPSRHQMERYEPYLREKEKKARPTRPDAGGDAGAVPWWQRDDANLNEIKLEELDAESDGILARRMVKGFYVAVDREFQWSGRVWYKTTKGQVGPKDRFWKVKGSAFEGTKINAHRRLPIGWPYGRRTTRPRYALTASGKLRRKGSVKRRVAIELTGEERQIDGKTYVSSRDGYWLRKDHLRIARRPPLPANLEARERWIDVHLGSQTLVAMIGRVPVYATLISSGKESEQEDQDHRTPSGEWRIREKHVTTTMDGNGSAAGDLPYSIEDVPYAMYFHGSYALHAAFWHEDFGMRRSHGCVNLAPLDARYLFFFTGPKIRPGWHGAWAAEGLPGSRVVIRE